MSRSGAEAMTMPAAADTRPTMLQDLVSAAFAAETSRFEGAVDEKARLCLVDFLACALEASPLPWSRQAAALAPEIEGGATIIGSAKHTSLEDAAFANGVAGHGLVREDMHAAAIAHLGVVVWPTLLGLAETQRIDGERLLRAAILGYEVGGRLGRAVMTPELARLYRPTGLVGPFAAALAGAVALDLDEATTCSALALAANTCGGLNEWPRHGADEMYFHPGFVARNALRALRLAQAGAWGSPSILEGPAGFFAAYGRTQAPERVQLFPEGPAEILTVFNKQVPACNFAQSACQAALAALRKSGLSPEDIAAVEVDTYEAALNYPGCAARGPFSRPLQAKMSIAYGVAATLACGAIEEENYARLDDPGIARLIDGLSFREDEAFTRAFPARQAARVTLVSGDGHRFAHEMDDVAFADAELIEQRFLKAAGTVLGQATASDILTRVRQLDGQADSSAIISQCGSVQGDTKTDD